MNKRALKAQGLFHQKRFSNPHHSNSKSSSGGGLGPGKLNQYKSMNATQIRQSTFGEKQSIMSNGSAVVQQTHFTQGYTNYTGGSSHQ